MRKLLPQLVIVMALAGALVQAAPGASNPATAHALSAYLGKMARLNAAVVQAENAQIKAIKTRPKKRANNTDPDVTRRALISTLLRTSSAMKRIVPPAVLKGPHAAFVSSLQLEAHGTNGRANTLRTRWRQAVTFQLRRAGLAVPHWVTQVRDPFA